MKPSNLTLMSLLCFSLALPLARTSAAEKKTYIPYSPTSLKTKSRKKTFVGKFWDHLTHPLGVDEGKDYQAAEHRFDKREAEKDPEGYLSSVKARMKELNKDYKSDEYSKDAKEEMREELKQLGRVRSRAETAVSEYKEKKAKEEEDARLAAEAAEQAAREQAQAAEAASEQEGSSDDSLLADSAPPENTQLVTDVSGQPAGDAPPVATSVSMPVDSSAKLSADVVGAY
jgi:hypothetical protein